MIVFLSALRNIGDVLGSALIFLYAKIFLSSLCFKGAKLAKFIRFEAMWKMSLFFITKFTENW